MRILVVFCHPVLDSFGARLRDTVLDALAAHETRLVDLYSGADLPRSFDHDDSDSLAWAEAIVLVYPTWWSSLPAPLMGWVEEGLDRDLWRHLSRVVAVTTHGSSRMVNWVTGGIGRRIVQRGLPKMMAEGSFGRFIALYSMDTIGDTEREQFCASLPETLASALK